MAPIRITPLNIGKLRFDLTDIYSLPSGHPNSGQIAEIPMYSYHIMIPGRSVLVDAVSYDHELITEEYLISEYSPPPSLLDQLSACGIETEEVTDVIITHAHTDHYGALCKKMGEYRQLSFPQAQHYLNAADWWPEAFTELEERTLRLVEQNGLLNLPEGEVDLGDGLTILPMPGETPGHQILRLAQDDNGKCCYFAGDLYHHHIELVDEAIDANWVDVNEMRASKTALMNHLASDQGVVYFTHIAGAYGIFEQEEGKFDWRELSSNHLV